MLQRKFNPRVFYWILAFIILVGGIFTLNFDFHFQFFGYHKALSFAHLGAITSGILSMVSFGYGAVKNHLPSIVLTIFHLLATVTLLFLAIYNGISLNLLEPALPTLESTAEGLKQWEAQNQDWAQLMQNTQRIFFAFVGLSAIAIAFLFYRAGKKSVPKIETT